jgi:tetratricopeptide (TPR) repeat protein
VTWLLWAALVGSLPAFAAPEDALDAATRPFFLKAVEEEAAGRHGKATQLYRMVLTKDPGFLPASLGVGRSLEAAGDLAGAEALYRSLGDEADAVEALALLVEPRDPAEALALWRRLSTLRLGDSLPSREEARLLAGTDPVAALAAYDYYEKLLDGAPPHGPTLLALGAALVDKGLSADAELRWRAYLDTFPDGDVAMEVSALLDGLEVARAAESLVLGGSEPLPPELVGLYAEAQRAMAEGRLDVATEAGRALVAGAPRSAEGHALLADVLVARRTWEEAEVHAILARALAPDDASNRVRLGLLLVEAYGGRRDREAAILRPGDIEVQVALGRLEQSLGSQDQGGYERAVTAYERALANGASGVTAEELTTRIEALRRTPPSPPDVPVSPRPRLPDEAEAKYRIASILARRGRIAEAIGELDAALLLAPDAPSLLNKRAQFAGQAGTPADAEPWLLRSLEADGNQPPVLLELAGLALARGDVDASRHWYVQAGRYGTPDAHYQLAVLAEARGDWATVRAELAAYEAAAPGRGSQKAKDAAKLQQRANGRLWALRASFGGGFALVVGLPLLFWARYRTARTLRDLLDGAPECWHDAARLLAALRHEVLKHNTTVLPDVADALARGDTRPWEAFRARAPSLLGHFRSYLAQLEALGRRHGQRLDLRRRDPILGPVHRALARLARTRRAPRPDDLRALSAVINGVGYRAIGAIVREICVLPVTPERARAVYARIVTEPGFAGAPVPALGVVEREQGLAVRMFRADLEDILANVLRNALAAGAQRLDVELAAFDDPITGHAWVEVAVVDDAPGTLTNAMIRGRYIGRGLGLAVDLINRHGGSIRVDSRTDGRKAVVVQLPSVEAAPVEVEEWTVS